MPGTVLSSPQTPEVRLLEERGGGDVVGGGGVVGGVVSIGGGGALGLSGWTGARRHEEGQRVSGMEGTGGQEDKFGAWECL